MSTRQMLDQSFLSRFIKEEVRCGFTVSEMMKRVWATELEILATIDRICREYEITYFADWGTLLGAVRHHGFIPWDDDIDLCMKREDYIRFLKILPDELPEEYCLRSHYAGLELENPWAIIANGENVSLHSGLELLYYGCPYVVGVDVFPLDVLPPVGDECDAQRLLYSITYDVAKRFEEYGKQGTLESYVKKIEELTSTRLIRDESLRKELWLINDRVASLYSEAEYGDLTELWVNVCRDAHHRIGRSCYAQAIRVPFENTLIPIPIGYNQILSMDYGTDYMTFKKDSFGSGHEYPFFKKQEFFLQEQRIKQKKEK